MLFDGINLAEDSTIQNLTVPSGDAFPAESSFGELFVKTGSNEGMYVYNGVTWVKIATGAVADILTKVGFVIKDPNVDIPLAIALSTLGSGFLCNSSNGDLSTKKSIDLSSSDVSGILSPTRLPSLTGDVVSIAGSNDISLTETGVSSGTYTKVTIDRKGRVISTSTATTLEDYGITNAVAKSVLGKPNGVATLDSDGKIIASQAPNSQIVEAPNMGVFPVIGLPNTIYIAIDSRKIYYWTDSGYTELSKMSSTDDLPEGNSNLYFTAQRVIDAIQDITLNGGDF